MPFDLTYLIDCQNNINRQITDEHPNANTVTEAVCLNSGHPRGLEQYCFWRGNW